MSSFSRTWDAVDRPLSILREAANGTLTVEAVDAVRNVYPALYHQMEGALATEIASHAKIPYTQRLGISMMLGQDMDGSLSPTLLMSTQKAYAGAGQQGQLPQQNGSKPTPARADKIQLARRAQTPSQAAASRSEKA